MWFQNANNNNNNNDENNNTYQKIEPVLFDVSMGPKQILLFCVDLSVMAMKGYFAFPIL